MHIILTISAVIGCVVVVYFVLFAVPRPRMQHYAFAHQLLPEQMFAEPLNVLVPMLNSKGFSLEGRAHLIEFWDAAGEGMQPKDSVPSESLTYSMEVLGHPNSTAYFVTLPTPIKKPEAYFVLMVFDGIGLCVEKIRHLRYFVLEFQGIKKGVPKTVIGEWKLNADDKLEYVDHGAGPLPEKEEFMARVQQIIEITGTRPS